MTKVELCDIEEVYLPQEFPMAIPYLLDHVRIQGSAGVYIVFHVGPTGKSDLVSLTGNPCLQLDVPPEMLDVCTPRCGSDAQVGTMTYPATLTDSESSFGAFADVPSKIPAGAMQAGCILPLRACLDVLVQRLPANPEFTGQRIGIFRDGFQR